jgi:hypothetical protein
MNMTWGNMKFDPFPTKIKNVVFRYSQDITLSPVAANAAASYVFRANSLYDPDYTGVGTQPYGHDQYATMYKYYRVNKAVITLTYNGVTGSASPSNVVMGTTIRTTPTVVVTSDHIREVKGTRCTAICGGLRGENRVQQTWDRNDVNVENFDSMTASFGANPNEQNYFHAFIAQNNTTPAGGHNIAVDIVYYAEVWSPLLQSQS